MRLTTNFAEPFGRMKRRWCLRRVVPTLFLDLPPALAMVAKKLGKLAIDIIELCIKFGFTYQRCLIPLVLK